MKKLRNVILTGSGATIPWGAPTTQKLTDLLRNDTVFINEKGERIGEYLYSILDTPIGDKRRYNEPNFEAILYLIEIIYEYRKSTYSTYPSFFRMKDFSELNSDINETLVTFEKSNPNLYANPNDKAKIFLDTAFKEHCLVANHYFYYELYLHFIFLIKNEVEQYEDGNSIQYSHLNEGFNLFIDELKKDGGIVRFYTLNYDYLPVNISNNKFFDGYDMSTGKEDLKRVIEDDEVDCFYHLHGSFRLNLQGLISSNYDYCSVQWSFTQNDFIPSNIISGYNKTDRIFNDSYYNFYQEFVGDCCMADRIFIIGYAFNDLHVNAAIKRTMQKGKVDIVCIDQCNPIDLRFPFIDDNKDYLMLELIRSPNTYRTTTEAPKLKAYLKGFENFLNMDLKEFYTSKAWLE